MIKTGLLILFIDSLYLYLIGTKVFRQQVKIIQGSKLKLEIIPTILSYFLLTVGLYYIIIKPNEPPWKATLLGVVIYGVFDMTNMAIFKNYSWKVAITDTIWGGILFYIVSKILT